MNNVIAFPAALPLRYRVATDNGWLGSPGPMSDENGETLRPQFAATFSDLAEAKAACDAMTDRIKVTCSVEAGNLVDYQFKATETVYRTP